VLERRLAVEEEAPNITVEDARLLQADAGVTNGPIHVLWAVRRRGVANNVSSIEAALRRESRGGVLKRYLKDALKEEANGSRRRLGEPKRRTFIRPRACRNH
jgi:hypothetical protein